MVVLPVVVVLEEAAPEVVVVVVFGIETSWRRWSAPCSSEAWSSYAPRRGRRGGLGQGDLRPDPSGARRGLRRRHRHRRSFVGTGTVGLGAVVVGAAVVGAAWWVPP